MLLGPGLDGHGLEMQPVFCIEDLTPLNAAFNLKMQRSCLFKILGVPDMVPRIRVSN